VPETRWARTVDGASIPYHDRGNGPTVLVHITGWLSHLEVYWEQPRYARFARRLAQNLRVLDFDKRGTGMSDRIMHGLDLEARMDDVRAVLDAAGVERAALLGWGTGGTESAVFFAAAHPERTIALCLDGSIIDRVAPDDPWGQDEDAWRTEAEALVSTWGQPSPELAIPVGLVRSARREIEHLRIAVDRRPGLREPGQENSALGLLRDARAFRALVDR
jgi:pimeloyl-ACP methyl ester carboxylesterase